MPLPNAFAYCLCLLPLPTAFTYCLCLLPLAFAYFLLPLPIAYSQILSNHSQAIFITTIFPEGNFGNFISLTLLLTLFIHHFRKVFFNGISILSYDPELIHCGFRDNNYVGK